MSGRASGVVEAAAEAIGEAGTCQATHWGREAMERGGSMELLTAEERLDGSQGLAALLSGSRQTQTALSSTGRLIAICHVLSVIFARRHSESGSLEAGRDSCGWCWSVASVLLTY
ncbi:hypothetical protein TrVFT333_003222 [Trichoderma virens FT-333]|nr:hypothetical protein TrVFT333_003222 [Trichoderma virens FT-333]